MSALRKSKPVKPVLALLAVALLAGCADRSTTVGSIPDDYRTNHPIVISEKEQVADIPVGHADNRLSITQRSIVQNVLTNYHANGSGVIHILLPSGTPNEHAAGRLREDIVAVLRRSGVKPFNISSERYRAASDESAPIRLSYSAMTASTGPCGQWPKDLLDTAENKHYANFGCASQNNLAAQIANPADLLGPRATTTIDAERRGKVIDAYRNATPPTPIIRQEVQY
ncbi:pilus assembly protein CpaD [Phyllobacterium myrsinacearum]|uniref:Pilus assembly protein CpaD n=2 Tax=Phyllobacteriaceae TaxID=69277 RepID=A0A2S9JCV2_9HYPH|nr:pilus assembly protein CpaD [Phyllobacterium myrsinacearum]PWV94875.1 pilus assembly protein CpaD [Phyllobacterium myrsinacearum]RZS87948.1 pilus assembly protein CpaD [Phyllobacterium myrsinacearum]RZV07014.1 pilus assembly protein CpaD [Phyllobacterium myrsinacearum]